VVFLAAFGLVPVVVDAFAAWASSLAIPGVVGLSDVLADVDSALDPVRCVAPVLHGGGGQLTRALG
jgi:hypothetical protein